MAVVVCAFLTSNSAVAGADDSLATQKFTAGTRASDRHDWSSAEALFEESIRLAPSVGAYYNRGYCLEQLGRSREAYRNYREAEGLATLHNDARRNMAHEAAARLLEVLHYVELDVPDDIASRPDLRIVIDGSEISEAQRRDILISDSPTHSVSVSAPGRMTWARKGIADRTRVTLEIGSLVLANPAEHVAPANAGWRANQLAALGAVGVGVVTLVVSSVLFQRGAAHIDALNDVKRRDCAGAGIQTSACRADDANARAYRSDIAVATTVLDVTGAIFLVGGAALWFAWPTRSSAGTASLRPQVGARHAGLSWAIALP